MFHRVKPETQSNAQEENSAEEAAAPAQRQAAPARQQQVNQQTKTQQQEEKDTSMNEQAQERDDDREEQSAPEIRRANIPTGTYQRPAQSPVRTPGYPGAYPGSSYSLQRPEASASSRTLTIGSGITMSGEIESCDYLLVEGTVEATLKGASVLDIAESGVFYGTVEIDEATVAGRFEGDITVNGRLTIRSTGTITGSIAYKELEVESGAVIDGRLTPVSAIQNDARKAPAAAASSNKQPAKAAQVSKKAAKDEQPSPANNDGELFSNKAAAAE